MAHIKTQSYLKMLSSTVLFLVRSFSTSVPSNDLDIHFRHLSLRSFASSVLLKRTEVDKDRSGRGPKWLRYRPLLLALSSCHGRRAHDTCIVSTSATKASQQKQTMKLLPIIIILTILTLAPSFSIWAKPGPLGTFIAITNSLSFHNSQQNNIEYL